MLFGCGGGNGDNVENIVPPGGWTFDEGTVTPENISEFVLLGEYRGIEFDAVSVEVTDEMIFEWVDAQMALLAEIVEVTDRPVMLGDIVILDFQGLLDGVPFEGGTAENTHLTIGSGMFIPGFEEQIVGHYAGEQFDIDITFPIPYHAPELEGQDVIFRINLISIHAEVVPELTDEFVRESLDGLNTVDEFLASLRAEMEIEQQLMADSIAMGQVWNVIVENATILQYPEDEIEYMMARDIEQFERHASDRGVTLSDLIFEISGLHLDDFIEYEVRPAAIEDVGQDLILRAVAAAEGITITEEEFLEGVSRFVETFNYESMEEFLEVNGERAVRITLLAERVIEVIMEHAVGI